MIRQVPYHINHLDLFSSDEDIEKLKAETEFGNSEAITIIIDDIPVISTGLRIINKNTGEIWMVKSKYLAKHKIYIIKALKQLIEFFAEEYGLKRMQTLINPENVKWIEGIGLEREAEMKGFSDDTIYIYRRLFA